MANLARHCDAVENLLAAVQGQPCWPDVSSKQAQALLAQLRKQPVSIEQAAELATKVGAMSWAPGDCNKMLNRIGAMSGEAAVPGLIVRRKQQNFENIGFYLSQQNWADMAQNEPTAVDTIAACAVALGLRNPTEPTIQRITALFLLCVEGQASTLSMQPAQLHEFFKMVKRQSK